MPKVAHSGTTAKKSERPLVAVPSTVARSQSYHNRHTNLPAIPVSASPPPPPPPPHDEEDPAPVRLQILDEKTSQQGLPPLPSKKTFYDNNKLSSSQKEGAGATKLPKYLEKLMTRYPVLSRHRRRFAALLFTLGTLILLLIVLLSVLLSRRASDNGGLGDSNGGGGWIGGGGGGGGFTIDPKTEEDLKKHNRGIPKPPINRSNAPGWTSQGQGDGTYYDPSIRNAVGGFQPGACEFEYINSVTDFIVALNKPDFGSFPRASSSPACGQCLQVTGPKGTIQVQVVDMCPGCKSGSLDFTPGAFSKIADLDQGRVPISWRRC